MISNDSRTEQWGIKLGETVEVRKGNAWFKGKVTRFTVTKAVVRLRGGDVVSVGRRQIEKEQ